MLGLLGSILLGGTIIALMLWFRRKLREHEDKLTSGEEIARIQAHNDGTTSKLKGTIEVRKPGIWYRVLINIDMEDFIEGRRHALPREYNTYSIAITNQNGKAVYNESNAMRLFVLGLGHAHKKEPSGIMRERHLFSRVGQFILLEFAPRTPGTYGIECQFQSLFEAKTEKFHFRSRINDLELIINKDITPLRKKGFYHHKTVKI
jgi:hypothetical protein